MLKKKLFLLAAFLMIIFIILSIIVFFNRGLIISKIVEKSFLQAGKPLKFGDYTVIIDKIEGNRLFGIRMDEGKRKFEAKSGDYTYLPEKKSIEINLVDGAVEDLGSEDAFLKHKLTFKKYHTIFKIK